MSSGLAILSTATMQRLANALESCGVPAGDPRGGWQADVRLLGTPLVLRVDSLGNCILYNLREGTPNNRRPLWRWESLAQGSQWSKRLATTVAETLPSLLAELPKHSAAIPFPAASTKTAKTKTPRQAATPSKNLVPRVEFDKPLAQVVLPGEVLRKFNELPGYEYIADNVFGTSFGRVLVDDGLTVQQRALYESTKDEGWSKRPMASLPFRHPRPAQGRRGVSSKKDGHVRVDLPLALLFQPPSLMHLALKPGALGKLLFPIDGNNANNHMDNLGWHPIGWKPALPPKQVPHTQVFVDLDAAISLDWDDPLPQAAASSARSYEPSTLVQAVRLWSEGVLSIKDITHRCGFSSDGYTRTVLGQYGYAKGVVHRSHEWLEPYRCKAVLELITADRVMPRGQLKILSEIADRHKIAVPEAFVAKVLARGK